MARVTGIGGVFVRSPDPAALAAWYAEHLGLPTQRFGGATFHWADSGPGSCTWAPFPQDTRYFGPGGQQMMVNFRVDDLDGMVTQLRAAGVEVEDPVADDGFGRFAWCADPDGNRVELWEPSPGL
ncbi:MAG TPA: VOC family protein [Pseudonocardiaceae bacterium]